jgi:hypothetical protein
MTRLMNGRVSLAYSSFFFFTNPLSESLELTVGLFNIYEEKRDFVCESKFV